MAMMEFPAGRLDNIEFVVIFISLFPWGAAGERDKSH